MKIKKSVSKKSYNSKNYQDLTHWIFYSGKKYNIPTTYWKNAKYTLGKGKRYKR